MNIEDLKGKVLTNIEISSKKDVIRFIISENDSYRMYHEQDCCERVKVEEIIGDLKDLIGNTIVQAEESTNQDNPPENAASFTWTFYKLATIKGYVTIRWLGESNGYYGESVIFEKEQ